MWTCHYRSVTHDVGNAEVTQVCCAATAANATLLDAAVLANMTSPVGSSAGGTWNPSKENCEQLVAPAAFITCVVSDAQYAPGVWTCSDTQQWCTGQRADHKCVSFSDDTRDPPPADPVPSGLTGASAGAGGEATAGGPSRRSPRTPMLFAVLALVAGLVVA